MDLSAFSSASLAVMDHAAREMYELRSGYLGVEHLFLGLLEECDPAVDRCCRTAGLDRRRFTGTLRSWLRRQRDGGDKEGETVFSPRLQRIQSSAGLLATRLGSSYIEPLHLFFSALAEERSVPSRLLNSMAEHGVPSPAALLQEAEKRLEFSPEFSEGHQKEASEKQRNVAEDGVVRVGNKAGDKMRREKDVLRIVEILARQHRNQVAIVADEGIGKRALISELADFLDSNRAPQSLAALKVRRLDAASLLSGAHSRNELEQRLQGFLASAGPKGDAVLVVEDLHCLLSSRGPLGEIADILRPALAQQGFRVIVTTTPEGFVQAQTNDPALINRFEIVRLEEPSEDLSLEILGEMKASFEKFHGVQISKAALIAAVRLTVRFVGERRLPQKAIDAMDQACASRLLTGLAAGETHLLTGSETPVVDAEDVAGVVSRWTNIPLEKVGAEESKRLLKLEEVLEKRLFGQRSAIEVVSSAVRAGRAGISDSRRPIAALLFVGPTGVGKTELSKVLAEELFGSKESLIRLDMTEYAESHSVARLIGAPPGYVGFGKDGELVSALRKRPYSVVLLDELEKAHDDIFDVLLPVLDEGRLQSTTGNYADFTNAIIVLTTNLLSSKEAPLGFGAAGAEEAEQDVRLKLAPHFRPEFINRLDNIVVFQPLAADDMRSILDRLLARLIELVSEQGHSLSIEDSVIDLLLEVGTDTRFGARPLERAVDRLLRRPLAEFLLGQKAGEAATLLAVCEDKAIVIRQK